MTTTDVGTPDGHEVLNDDPRALRLRIVGDGTRHGTVVQTLDGTPLAGVVRVELVLDADQVQDYAVITVRRVAVDVARDATVVRGDR